jgi:hypothetical protein
MKIKLLMLALSLTATGIATAMVGSDADRSFATPPLAIVLTPDGYAHATSFIQLSQTDASFEMPVLSLIQISLFEPFPTREYVPDMALDSFLPPSNPLDAASSQVKVLDAAVTSTSEITQVGYFDAAYQLSPHVTEPQTWAILLAGMGLIGLQLRRANRSSMAIN